MTQYLTCEFELGEELYVRNLLKTDFKSINYRINKINVWGEFKCIYYYLRFDPTDASCEELAAWKRLKSRIQSRRYRERKRRISDWSQYSNKWN